MRSGESREWCICMICGRCSFFNTKQGGTETKKQGGEEARKRDQVRGVGGGRGKTRNADSLPAVGKLVVAQRVRDSLGMTVALE